MKRKHAKIIIYIFIASFVLWISNPTEKDYISYIRENYKNAYNGSVKSSPEVIDRVGNKIQKGELNYDLEYRITYSFTHHVLFSTGSVVEYSKKYEYLRWYHIGILGIFFTSNKHYYPYD